MGTSQELYKKAKHLIPGGTQLLSKRPEMFLPDGWPAYYEKASGCDVWDMDGKKYTDMSYMGIGACMLGYADPDVDAAVRTAVDNGSMNTLNNYEEVSLAELLCALHPWADMVRFARCGGEAMSIAVRIARAASGKDIVIFSGYHGWHDWYLAANLANDAALDGHLLPGLSPNGVPRGLTGSAVPFVYNDTATYLNLLDQYKGKIAAVVIETIRNRQPTPGFLETIRKTTADSGIIMMCDEVSSGWRLCVGGAHMKFNLSPDMAVFAKALSNGYPMAAIIGKREYMQKAQETFISSTYWTERIGPTAALATIKKLEAEHVPLHLDRVGRAVQAGWADRAKQHGIDITVDGIHPLSHFTFNYKNSLAVKTFFTQLMLEKGFLATNAFYASLAHTIQHVDEYIEAVGQAFSVIKEHLEHDDMEQQLKGPVCHAGFRRLD